MENKASEKESKTINPLTDCGNYLVQAKIGDQVVKQMYVQGGTINVINVGDQPVAFDVR